MRGDRLRGPAAAKLHALAGGDGSGRSASTEIVLLLAPPAADVLFFIPWGFLVFMAADRRDRPRSQTLLIAGLAGLAFSLLLNAWQYALPTMVTDLRDIFWDTLGALAGAALGHLRKKVQFRFE